MKSEILSPRSIAVVGASQDSEKIGSVILKNIIEGGYNGKVYPINPKYKKIQERETFASVMDVPDNIDLVCIVIPPQFVEKVVEECIEKKVKGIVIITAGFKETGEEGKALEKKITKKAKDAGIRILGPNCLGYINNDINLNLTFARENPGSGDVAFISQSGAFCTAVLDIACKENFGFSQVISLGNKADIYENEILEDLEKDKDTKAVALYLEEFSDGKEFVALSQKSKKPYILIAPGSSEKAKQAISSHTGSLASSYDTAIAAIKKGNIIQAENSQELFDLMYLLHLDKLPKGNRVAVITNAGGPGILATDYIEKYGLQSTEFGEKTTNKLIKILPEAASVKNPIDVLGDAKDDRYSETLEIVLEDKDVDSVLVLLTPQLITNIEEIAGKISKIQMQTSKPIFCSFLGGKAVESGINILKDNKVFVSNNIESTLKIIGKLSKYVHREENTKRMNSDDFKKRGKYRKDIEKLTTKEVSVLDDELVENICNEFKINIPKQLITANLEEATSFASLNFPVAIKASSIDLAHKTDFDGLYLDIRTVSEFEEKFNILQDNIEKVTGRITPKIIIQEMIDSNAEIFIGANREGNSKIYEKDGRGFGHLLAFGQGGIYTEVYKDIKHILVPEYEGKIEEILNETKVSKILDGYRGKPKLAKEKLLNMISNIQKLLINYPEIVSMDINPVMVSEKDAVAVDIKMYVKS